MTIIFDGREFARKKEAEQIKKVEALKGEGITPKLVSILIGDNPASLIYSNLKKRAAERIGAEMEIRILDSEITPSEIIEGIKKLNEDQQIHGIMIQMPLPLKIENYKLKILDAIAASKDIDGLREKSDFIPATVKAIILIMKEADNYLFDNVVVVGSTGMVGKPLVKLLKQLEYKVTGVDIATKNLEEKTKKADLIISATGKPGLIKADMVKDPPSHEAMEGQGGVVIIDVGSPKGDVDPEVYKKASFYTPVPGGVGPVTIASLLDNLLIASKAKF